MRRPMIEQNWHDQYKQQYIDNSKLNNALAEEHNARRKCEIALHSIRKVVDSQANDNGLWFVAYTASEAYLQQELRKLHDMIEKYT
jgi:hypothetical protein